MGIETIQTVDRFQWTFTGNPHLFAEKSLVPVKFKLVHWNKFHVSYLICVSTHQWYQIIRTYGFVRKYGTPNPMARHFPIKITLLGYTPRSDTPRYHRCWWRPIKSEIHSEEKNYFKKKWLLIKSPFNSHEVKWKCHRARHVSLRIPGRWSYQHRTHQAVGGAKATHFKYDLNVCLWYLSVIPKRFRDIFLWYLSVIPNIFRDIFLWYLSVIPNIFRDILG